MLRTADKCLAVSQNRKIDMCDSKVLIWQNQPSWHKDILDVLSDIIDDEVINEFHSVKPEYIVSDDLSWIEDIIFNVKRIEIDLKFELFMRMQKIYSNLQAFHSSSALQVEAYYENGLRKLNVQTKSQFAKEILMNNFSDISDEEVTDAINNTEHETRENRVFFEANEKFLIEHCGHYLHYGSEYQVCVAASLGDVKKTGIDYRQVFKGLGKPTVFICNVPFKYIPTKTLLELSGSIIETIFNKIQDEHFEHPSAGDAFGFYIDRDLESEYIVSHYHPSVIRDPIVK